MDMRMAEMNGFKLATIFKTIVSTGVYPYLRRPRFPTVSPGSAVFRQAAMIFISQPFAIAALETRLANLVSVDR